MLLNFQQFVAFFVILTAAAAAGALIGLFAHEPRGEQQR
jgi:hypothetical protein